jgi:hypothetical protein
MPPKSKECVSSPKDKKRSKKRQQLKASEQNNIMDNNLRIAQQNSSELQIQVISLIENYNKTKSYEIPTF